MVIQFLLPNTNPLKATEEDWKTHQMVFDESPQKFLDGLVLKRAHAYASRSGFFDKLIKEILTKFVCSRNPYNHSAVAGSPFYLGLVGTPNVKRAFEVTPFVAIRFNLSPNGEPKNGIIFYLKLRGFVEWVIKGYGMSDNILYDAQRKPKAQDYHHIIGASLEKLKGNLTAYMSNLTVQATDDFNFIQSNIFERMPCINLTAMVDERFFPSIGQEFTYQNAKDLLKDIHKYGHIEVRIDSFMLMPFISF